MAQSITDILNKAEKKVEQLNSPRVVKARGVANLLRIVVDLLRILATMQKKMSELETRVKELEDQLSSNKDRAG